MSQIVMTFRGMCLSSTGGKKNNYNKFISEPDAGLPATEIEVSSADGVDVESLWKVADWTLTGINFVKGTTPQGRQYSFLSCKKIVGKLIK
jgi:hypothetical protein